jgi:hypothetical protein
MNYELIQRDINELTWAAWLNDVPMSWVWTKEWMK